MSANGVSAVEARAIEGLGPVLSKLEQELAESECESAPMWRKEVTKALALYTLFERLGAS